VRCRDPSVCVISGWMRRSKLRGRVARGTWGSGHCILRQALYEGEVLASRPKARRLAHPGRCGTAVKLRPEPPACAASLGARHAILHVCNELEKLDHPIAIPIAVPNRIERAQAKSA
jgi:hypothetical protein